MLENEFPSINKKKEFGFRIYIAQNAPVHLAKIYKSYIKNIKKLYGALHIYLWDTTVVSENDVNWKAIREQLTSKTMIYIKDFISEEVEEKTVVKLLKSLMISQDKII